MEPWSWVHPPFHSALEGCGAVVALLLAWLVAELDRRGEGTSFNPQVIAALVCLGLLDGFHAVTHPGDAFVWLRGTSTFACGAMALLVWLPRRWVAGVSKWLFPSLAVALAAAFASTAALGYLPPMLEDGRLTDTAKWLNLSGGFLLAVAALRLFLVWRQNRRTDDFLFCFVGSLTAGAAITLANSEMWSGTWWISHALRFGANAGGLWFLAFTDTRLQAKADAASRALAELNASLEERVARRTAELEVARDAANAASRAKSEFLANMSHEIRTPLNAVIGLTEVVLRTDLDDYQRDHLETVSDSGHSLVQVINDILDFSKIEAGKVDLERTPFSPEDTICETLKPLAVRAQEKGIELAFLVRPEVPLRVMGDPTRLRQVVTNLVANAIAYTEEGQVLVRVERIPEPPRLQVSVLDSGVGIPLEKQSRIFESFEQADSSSTRRYGGTGLGLSISRRLVELMGGEIDVASEPGVGSVFRFTLPCEAAPDAAEAAERRAALMGELAGTRVLILSPRVTERKILAAKLGAAGMRPVTSVVTSDAALALLEGALAKGDPIRDIVVSANAPDDDAFALVGLVRERSALDDARLILLTTAEPDEALHDVAALGIVARLSMPARESELLEALAGRAPRTALHEKGAGAAGAVARQDPPLEILLVEDSPANQKLAVAILGEAGHRVVVASDGAEALACHRDGRFDVVLMDIQMPDMDGFQATTAIRAGKAGPDRDVPVVAMTAHALIGDRENCLAAGMDAYVAKPIRRDELLATLRRVARTTESAA